MFRTLSFTYALGNLRKSRISVLQNAFQLDQLPSKRRCKFAAVVGRRSANSYEKNSSTVGPPKQMQKALQTPLQICSGERKFRK